MLTAEGMQPRIQLVRVERIGRGFCVAGREVEPGEVVTVPIDVAQSLAACGKVEIVDVLPPKTSNRSASARRDELWKAGIR
jgi:hypothetical protein